MSGVRVAITGRAMLTPLGDRVEEVWENWARGHSSFAEVDSPITSMAGSRYIGVCRNIDRSILPDRKVQKAIARKDLIGLVAALSAAKDAGLEKGSFTPEKVGMYVGAGSTQVGDLEAYFPLIQKCMKAGEFDGRQFGTDLLGSVNPMVMLQTLMNNTLCYTSVALDIRGVNANYMDFQISGLRAIAEAHWAIMSGRADVIIAGGVAARPEPFQAEQGIQMGYLARTDEQGVSPDEAIRPYDRARSGTILSEGAAFVVLEREDHAARRGATITGYIEGAAVSADNGFGFINQDCSRGMCNALQLAIKRCGWRHDQVDLIMGHGNGSVNGDFVEADAYEKVFGEKLPGIPLTSPKSLMGEMSEAAAAANLCLGLEAVKRQTILPTTGYQAGDGPCAKLGIVTSNREFLGTNLLVTARSFSGLNCVLGVSGS